MECQRPTQRAPRRLVHHIRVVVWMVGRGSGLVAAGAPTDRFQRPEPPAVALRGTPLRVPQRHMLLRLSARGGALTRAPALSLARAACPLANNQRRALCSPPIERKSYADRQEEELRRQEMEFDQFFWERIRRSAPEPKLRSPVPPPPSTHLETWANRDYVSANVDENALSFRTRFYIDAMGEQPDYAHKVQLVVKLSKLGLTPLEERRLIAVALPHYNRKRKELHFSCTQFAEVGRNKDVLRRQMAALIADARENAEGHAQISDSELPLAVRSRPWLPRDRRVILNRPKRKMNKSTTNR